jgi:hypothetical protein
VRAGGGASPVRQSPLGPSVRAGRLERPALRSCCALTVRRGLRPVNMAAGNGRWVPVGQWCYPMVRTSGRASTSYPTA